MTTNEAVTLFHSPQTRSSASLTLLEELGAPYELHVLNMKAGEQRQSAYQAINPLGKVPAIRHGEALVTEQVAIFLFLSDLFPQSSLAPSIGDPLRGPYLRWMVYYAACYEPALVDRAMKREPAPLAMSPYGDFDTMLGALVKRTRLVFNCVVSFPLYCTPVVRYVHAISWYCHSYSLLQGMCAERTSQKVYWVLEMIQEYFACNVRSPRSTYS